MRWIAQEPETRNCGQIALAVLGDIDYTIAERMIGHKHGTTTKELVAALRVLGFDCPDRCRPMDEPPVLGLAQVRSPRQRRTRRNWHWVVVNRGRIFDGAWGSPTGHVLWPHGWKITSYLPVTR